MIHPISHVPCLKPTISLHRVPEFNSLPSIKLLALWLCREGLGIYGCCCCIYRCQRTTRLCFAVLAAHLCFLICFVSLSLLVFYSSCSSIPFFFTSAKIYPRVSWSSFDILLEFPLAVPVYSCLRFFFFFFSFFIVNTAWA